MKEEQKQKWRERAERYHAANREKVHEREIGCTTIINSNTMKIFLNTAKNMERNIEKIRN